MLNWIAGLDLDQEVTERVMKELVKWVGQIRKSQSAVFNIFKKYEKNL